MRTFFTILAIVVITVNANAKIWRVNVNANLDADFTSIQAAHDSAGTGDTLLIENGNYYGAVTISKLLYIYGIGYSTTHLGAEFGYGITQYNGEITFDTGSAGSIISGFLLTSSLNLQNTSNIIIEGIKINSGSPAVSLFIQATASDIVVRNSIFLNDNKVADGAINILFSNCKLNRSNTPNFHGVIIDQCVIPDGAGMFSNSSFTNCIFLNNYAFSTTYLNNISYSLLDEDLPDLIDYNEGTSNYIGVVSSADLFTGTTEGVDYYRLNPDAANPALTCGENGNEAGMYGGTAPFVYGGVPSEIPVITRFVAPVTVGDSMQIEINAKIIE